MIPTASRAQRPKVAWFGSEPPADAVEALDRLQLEASRFDFQLANDPAYLSALSAVVVTLTVQGKLYRTIVDLSSHAGRLLNNGVNLFVLSSFATIPVFVKFIRDNHLPVNGLPAEQFSWQDANAFQVEPSVTYRSGEPHWPEITRLIATRGLVERANLQLKIEGQLPDPEMAALIRRAFSDYGSIHLTRISDGFSGAATYKVQATRGGGVPVPYFMKIGPRDEIQREYTEFLIGVEPYVPYHLAPALVKDSCCLGAEHGVIVEHFVSESESLLDCAEGGRVITPLACLFGRTLNAWHRSSETKALSEFVDRKFPKDADNEVLIAARALGDPSGIPELRAQFDRYGGPLAVSYGLIHGDLHGKNVRVRGADAVIIDMEKHSTGPLLWDPACLEASFLIEGFSNDKRDANVWFSSIERCFTHPLYTFWSHDHLTDESSWFHIAINHIRLYVHAMSLDAAEYFAVLGAALLWKATKGVRDDGDNTEAALERRKRECMRRGAAYLLAQQLFDYLPTLLDFKRT